MAPIFQSLGELSAYVEDRGAQLDFTTIDAGVPLVDMEDLTTSYGPVWSNQPSIRKVVTFIARNIASIPLHLYDRVSDTDRQRVTDHPLAKLLDRPSSAPGQFAYRFWEALLIDGLLKDRWCAMVLDGSRRNNGDPELVRIPARRVRFVADGLDRITTVRFWLADGTYDERPAREFLLDVGYAERGASGTSPMVTLKHLLDEQRQSVDWRRKVWKRGARIPAVIEKPTPWPADGKARERFEASWAKFEARGGAEGGTPILEDGMKYRPLDAFRPQDMDDLEGRRLTDIEVASAYQIAPELVGARQGNYANIEAFRQMVFREHLGPYIDAWAQALNYVLIPRFAPGSNFYIEPHLEAKLRGSFEEQVRTIQTATGAPWLLRSEARARMNLPEIADADRLVVPLNVLQGGQASPTDAGQGRPSGSAARTAAVDRFRAPDPHRALKRLRTAQRGTKNRAPETHDAKWAEVISDFFGRQGRGVRSKLGAGADEWWDGERWDRELAGDIQALATLTSEEVGADVLDQLGFAAGTYDPELTVNWLARYARRVAEGVNVTTKDQLDAALEADDPDAEVATVFDTASDSRANEIAVTSVTAISGWSATEAARQVTEGNDEATATKTWQTNSTNPRPTHAAMNGETVGIDDPFSNGAMWPGDALLDVGEIAGCQCSVVITIEGGE